MSLFLITDNPVEHIKSRIKSEKSIKNKLKIKDMTIH